MMMGTQELLLVLLTAVGSLPQVLAGNVLGIFVKILVQVAFRVPLFLGM